MVLAMMLGLANVMKDSTVTIAQVNFRPYNNGLLTKENFDLGLNNHDFFFVYSISKKVLIWAIQPTELK